MERSTCAKKAILPHVRLRDKSYITTPIPGENIQGDAFPRFSQSRDLSVCYFVGFKRRAFFLFIYFFKVGFSGQLLAIFFRRRKLNLGVVLSPISLETFLSSDSRKERLSCLKRVICAEKVQVGQFIYFFCPGCILHRFRNYV